ncbi:MAG: hypothetical protein RLZZ450_3979, partial [Pseudomonadota bacterium]
MSKSTDKRAQTRVFRAVRFWRQRKRRVRLNARSTHNRITLLHDGAQALPAMLEAIHGAAHEVLLEMYWFGSDRTGRRFADALLERVKKGVRVCVTYDAIGSLEAGTAMFYELRDAGVEVHEFHPIAPWRT